MSGHINFIDSTATGAGNGNTWVDAYASIAIALIATGNTDVLWVAEEHVEVTSGDTTFNKPGGIQDPIPMYRMNKATNEYSPVTQDGLANASIDVGGNFNIRFHMNVVMYGFRVVAGGDFTLDTGDLLQLHDCEFEVATGAAKSGDFVFDNATIYGTNTTFRCTNHDLDGSELVLTENYGSRFVGCKFVGVTKPTGYITIEPNDNLWGMFDDCDFRLISGDVVVDTNTWVPTDGDFYTYTLMFNYCHFKTGYQLTNSDMLSFSASVSSAACAAANETGSHRMTAEQMTGVVETDDDVFLSPGFINYDAAVQMSYVMKPTALCSFYETLKSPWFGVRLPAGGNKSLTVHVMTSEGWVLHTGQVWIEVSRMSTGQASKFRDVSDNNPINNVAALPAGDTWIGGEPVVITSKIAYTIDTPDTGLYYARVHLGAYSSATRWLYVNPEFIIEDV